MAEHRPTLRSLLRGPRRCRVDGLRWPCPTSIEGGHYWTGDTPIPDSPPVDFIKAGQQAFTHGDKRRNVPGAF